MENNPVSTDIQPIQQKINRGLSGRTSIPSEKYKEGWDRIFGRKDEKAKRR